MRRLLPLLTVSLFALAAAAQDFRAAKEEFEAAFNPARPALAREQALAGLVSFDDRETLKLVLSGIPVCDAVLAPLLDRKKELDAELHGLLDDQIFEQERRYPKETHEKIKDLKYESVGLQVRIDGELKVLAGIEHALSTFRDPEAVKHLYESALTGEKLWRSRLMVAEALGEIGVPESVKHLTRALRDKDDRVRVAVIVTLGRLRAAEALKELVRSLDDDVWTVRAAAIEALGEIGEKGAVKALIEQIAREEGRLQLDCANALARLTGERFGAMPEAWKRWWEEHKGEYEGEEPKELGGHPAPPPGGSDGGYYGIPIQTDRAIFVLDVSGSMGEPSSGDAGISKIESAKNELSRALRGFSPKGKFNLIVFNDTMKQWKDSMVPATAATKEEAQAWVKDLSAASSTNIYDAMDAAFRLAGMGARDKHYELGADTIFLLSDGSPTTPDGQLDDWEKIIRAVREWNKLKRVVVHTIGIGGHNAAFMSTLARENGGTYVAR